MFYFYPQVSNKNIDAAKAPLAVKLQIWCFARPMFCGDYCWQRIPKTLANFTWWTSMFCVFLPISCGMINVTLEVTRKIRRREGPARSQRRPPWKYHGIDEKDCFVQFYEIFWGNFLALCHWMHLRLQNNYIVLGYLNICRILENFTNWKTVSWARYGREKKQPSLLSITRQTEQFLKHYWKCCSYTW